MSSVVWARRRARWALHKEAVAAAKNDPIVSVAEFAAAHREAIEDRGRDFVEDTKHSHD